MFVGNRSKMFFNLDVSYFLSIIWFTWNSHMRKYQSFILTCEFSSSCQKNYHSTISCSVASEYYLASMVTNCYVELDWRFQIGARWLVKKTYGRRITWLFKKLWHRRRSLTNLLRAEEPFLREKKVLHTFVNIFIAICCWRVWHFSKFNLSACFIIFGVRAYCEDGDLHTFLNVLLPSFVN